MRGDRVLMGPGTGSASMRLQKDKRRESYLKLFQGGTAVKQCNAFTNFSSVQSVFTHRQRDWIEKASFERSNDIYKDENFTL